MEDPLRVLVVEDLPSDFEIIKREIRTADINCIFTCVDTKEDFINALNNFKPEFILSDYSLPQFNGMEALKIAKEFDPLIPFIIVTGSINEETAVACIKAGAEDYVIKEHIRQLAPVLQNAMLNKQNLLAKLEAEKELLMNEQHLQTIVEAIPDGILILDSNFVVLFANKKAKVWLTAEHEEIIGTKLNCNLELSKKTECRINLSSGISGKAEMSMTEIKWDNEPAYLVMLRADTLHVLPAQQSAE